MKQILGTFFSDTEENFLKMVSIFEKNDYEVARQGTTFQGVIFADFKEEKEDIQE